MSPSFREIQLEIFNKDLEKLKKDYEAVAEKKRRESNPVEKNNLESQLQSLDEKINKIEQEIKDLEEKAKDNKIKELQEILSKFTTTEEILIIKKAYQACSSQVCDSIATDEPKAILANLMKMPQGNSKYTKVDHFAACLLVLIENQSLITKLKNWAEENINDFDDLFNQEKKALAEKRKENTNSYLLIVLEKSNQDSARNNLDCYAIKAWFIPDIDNYKYNNVTFYGCKQINSPDDMENQKTFTSTQVHQQIKRLFDVIHREYNYCPSNLTVEIFLPLDILNHPVDGWQLEEDEQGFSSRIGELYKVVIRSYDRLLPNYPHKNFWKEKWDKIINLQSISNLDNPFFSGNDSNANKVAKLRSSNNTIGLKISTAPQKVGKGSIFAAIVSSAIPVALWLRKNLTNLDCECEIDTILKCDIHKLPEIIKDKRFEADDPNTDIGHHIS
ncbi:MAG: hypothetical protein WBA39_04770, partial [Rivularia sp. (in: cyanobacteria)]